MPSPGNREELKYVLAPPTGGVNTRGYPTEIPDNNYLDLCNWDYSANLGAFVQRKGTTAFNTTLATELPVRGAIRWYYGSAPTREQIMISGTDIFFKTGAPGSFAVLLAGVTADRDWFFASLLDRLYMANGIDTVKVRDGPAAYIRSAGFIAPLTAPTIASGGGGVLTGSYRWKISFVYDSIAARESTMGPASATFVAAGDQAALSAIPLGGTGVTSRNVYRTKANGSTFFFVGSIPDNVTTTFADNVADNAQGTNQGPDDNGIPPTGSQFVIAWRGRMVYAKTPSQPQRVFLAAINSTEKSPGGGTTIHGAGPEIFPASHFIDVGDDNSPITGLAVLQDQLVIFKEDKIYNLQGDDARDMAAWASQSATGCIAPKTIVNMKGTIFFLGRNEGSPTVYSFDGSQAEDLSLVIEPTLRTNIRALGDIATQPIQACATKYRGGYMLCYRLATSSLNEVAILDTRPPIPRWMFWDKIEASVFSPWNGPGDSGEMYYGHMTEGRMLKLDFQETDYSPTTPTAIVARIETKFLDLGKPYQWKQIDYIEVYGKAGPKTLYAPDPGTPTVTMERIYDFNTVGSTQDFSAIVVAPVVTGHTIWKHRISGGGSDAATFEQGYIAKLKLTCTALVEIYKIVVYFHADPPGTTHDN